MDAMATMVRATSEITATMGPGVRRGDETIG
jgi:hypothetical protein